METNEPSTSSTSSDQQPEAVTFDIMEVRYSLPTMLRELQIERSHSYFAKEIIDQVEISKIFAQARDARAKRKKL